MSWNVIPMPGVRADSLGGYLSALGVLCAVTHHTEWNIRGSWRYGHFVLQSEAASFNKESLQAWLLSSWQPVKFEKWWGDVQSGSKDDPNAVARARAQEPDDRVDELDMVMVQSRRRVFNDLLGTGGNVGKRNLPKVWKECRSLCKNTNADAWLDQTLFGNDSVELPELKSAGTWFVSSNKTFNSGQDWYREGRLSPWSFLLAMEGVRLLRGGVHRRHGARITGKAVFPFMCRPAAPPTNGQIAHGKSEFWAPLWNKLATLVEVEELFRGGLAEVGGRPASAPHEFAVAALGAGVDSGIVAFAPFELRQTTSAQVFEAIPRDQIRIERSEGVRRCADLILPLIRSGWLDRLPREPRDAKQRGRFVGLRGPVEAGIVRVSERPNDEEAWRVLLLLLAHTQQKIDRNRTLREQCIPLPQLPEQWFDMAWPDAPVELQIARAIASINQRPSASLEAESDSGSPIITNMFGVEAAGPRAYKFPAARPARAVWHYARPLQSLISVLQRRLIDADELAAAPLHAAAPCCSELVARFLYSPPDIDDELLVRWIPALSLLSWKRRLSGDGSKEWSPHPLYSLIRPILDPDDIEIDRRPLFPLDHHDARRPHTASARKLVNLILQGDIDQAVQLARRRYLAAGWRTFDPPAGELWIDRERLAAALLIPMNTQSLSRRLREDWILSSKSKYGKEDHAYSRPYER